MVIQNHKLTNIAYHFLVEAMVIFLFAVPLMEYKYQWIPPPYWGYLGIALAICVIFSLYTTYTQTYLLYFVSAPFLVGLFYISGYPLFLSVVFPILLTYRYVSLRKDTLLKGEMLYIHLTVVWTIILLIWLKETQVIIYAFLILMFLLIGHLLSHYMAIDKQQRTAVKRKLWMTIGTTFGISAVGLLLLYVFRNMFTGIWQGLMSVIGYVTGRFGLFLGYLLPDLDSLDMKKNEESIENEVPEQRKDPEDILPDKNEPSLLEEYDYLIFWGVGVIILIIIIILAIRHYRSRFHENPEAETEDVVTYSSLGDISQQKTSMFSPLFRAPEHKVRKLIFQLERDAAKANAGRLSYETLDAWLERLGVSMDMTTYKKVRYGNVEEVSEKEVQSLKEGLEDVIKRLKKEHKNRKGTD